MQNQVKLKILYDCNADCIFCTEKVKDKIKYMALSEVKSQIDKAAGKENVFLIITGGEVTLRNDLIEIIKYSRSKGITNICIQTNGIRLADKEYALSLIEAGLSVISFTFTGPNPEIHDSLVKANGAFEKVVQGIKNIQDKNIRILINFVITQANYKSLEDFARFVSNNFRKIEHVQLSLPCIQGSTKTNFFEVVPQFSIAYKYILSAADILLKNKIDIIVDNLPLCFMDGYEEYASDVRVYFQERHGRIKTFTAAKGRSKDISKCEGIELKENFTKQMRHAKVKADICKMCNLSILCDGVWIDYGNIFTLSELCPIYHKTPEDILNKAEKNEQAKKKNAERGLHE